jgi:lysophospholipase L1-like esterase
MLLMAACSDATASSSMETVASTSTLPPTTTTTTIPAIDLPLPAGANTVYILGDSVILGTQYVINQQLAGWQVTLDAKVSRRMDQGLGVVAAKGGNLGRVVVVHLCTNWYGGDYAAAAETLIATLRGADRIVWSTCVPWVGAINQANDAIKALPALHPNLAVVDWAAIAGTPGYTAGDGLHLQGQGQYAMADLVAKAIGPAPPPA